jgi:ubiquinone/menaquinone biosynthesis C-methylase UbiE
LFDDKEKQVTRTHDVFYSNENPVAPPKDSFIKVANLIEIYLSDKKKGGGLKIVDMGCATGSFVNYLSLRFPTNNVIGYEYLQRLIDVGRKHFPTIELVQGSILDKSCMQENSVDVISVLGVISIFDEIESILQNLISWVKPGGKVFIHGMFNPLNVDVYVKYQLSENFRSSQYESGWNIISQKTISNLLLKNGASKIKFHPFELTLDLNRKLDDPLRSWTETLADGSRQIVNGTCLKQPQYILEFDV